MLRGLLLRDTALVGSRSSLLPTLEVTSADHNFHAAVFDSGSVPLPVQAGIVEAAAHPLRELPGSSAGR